MIRTVLFDVGGTLIHANPSVGGVYSRVAERHGVTVAADVLEQRFRDAWGRIKKVGQTVEKEWWRQIVHDVFDGHILKDPDGFFEDLYDSFRDPKSWTIFPDVLPTLERLRRSGCRLAIASNWDERLPPLLEALDLSRHFDQAFISFSLGVSKPDRRFFETALAGMRASAAETAHVGDDPEEDVRGAGEAGLTAFLISRKKPSAGTSIASLLELPARLEAAR